MAIVASGKIRAGARFAACPTSLCKGFIRFIHHMTLGVALLWLGRYAEAWEHFHSVIEKAPRVGDSYYGMAGVAK